MKRTVVTNVLLLLCSSATTKAIALENSGPCTVCKGGADISLPDKSINIPGFTFLQTCRDLNDTIPMLLQQEDESCQQLQSLGSLCGCPIEDEETKCNLCGNDNGNVGAPEKEIPLFPDLFPVGITPTCDLFQAYLKSLSANDGLCGMGQTFMSTYCQCPSTTTTETANRSGDDSASDAPAQSTPSSLPCSLCPDGSTTTIPDAPTYIGFQGFETCGELEQAAQVLLTTDHEYCAPLQSISPLCGCPSPIIEEDAVSCSMCADGSKVPHPEKVMPFIDGAEFFGGGNFAINVTCGLYEAFLMTVSVSDDMCPMAQALSSYCGCPKLENHCEFCPNGERVQPEYYPTVIKSLQRGFQKRGGDAAKSLKATCEFAEALTFQIPKDNSQCQMRYKSYLCGCNNGKSAYPGTETEARKVALHWIPRVSSILSLMGSSTIAFDILSNKDKRIHIYCQLIMGVVVFDVITALGFAFTSTAQPAEVDGEFFGVYGARGNEATCYTQAIFIHLGYGTIPYNVSLCLYYTLIIVLGWKESRLRRVTKWLHGVPICIAVIIAFAGLSHYRPGIFGCTLRSSPWAEEKWPFTLLMVVPVYVGVSVMLCLLGVIYWKVRKDERAADKWRLSTIESAYLEEEGTSVLRPSEIRQTQSASTWSRLSNETGDTLEAIDESARASVMRGGSERVSAKSRVSNRTDGAMSQRSKLERQVFWQCLSYIFAFCLVYPVSVGIGLYFGINDATNFSGLVFVSLFGPLEGFFNAIVYFRPRLACCDRTQPTKVQERPATKSAISSNGSLNGPKRKSSISLIRAESEPSIQIAHEIDDPTPADSKEFEYTDPSIAVLDIQ